MEIKKICFRCGIEQPLSDYYKHPKTKDGHLNKCKTCTKSDSSKKEAIIRSNPELLQKERERHREKRIRLGYNNKIITWEYCITADCRKKINTIYKLSKNQEVHHWNYNYKYSVFVIDIRLHKKFHKLSKYESDSKCYFSNGYLLDSKEKHKQRLIDISNEFDLSNEIIEIETTVRSFKKNI